MIIPKIIYDIYTIMVKKSRKDVLNQETGNNK